MNTNSNDSKGIIRVSEETIAILAAKTALETDGVAALSGTLPDKIAINFSKKDSSYKGVKVSKDDEGFKIDIYVVVDFDENIPSVAWDIQKNIKHEIKSKFGLSVKSINVHVQGVRLP